MSKLEDISNDFAITFDFDESTVDVKHAAVSFYNKDADATVIIGADNFEDIVRAFVALNGEGFLVEDE